MHNIGHSRDFASELAENIFQNMEGGWSYCFVNEKYKNNDKNPRWCPSNVQSSARIQKMVGNLQGI